MPARFGGMRKFLVISTLTALVLTGCVPTAGSDAAEIPAPTQIAPSSTVRAFDKTDRSIDEASSLWVVANKLRRLSPLKFAPTDLVTVVKPWGTNGSQQLRSPAASQYKKMVAAAKADGITLVAQSGYRSYGVQVSVYNSWVNRLGVAQANLQSAKPGHSEHQTGWSIDIAGVNGCTIAQCFAHTIEGEWLNTNAWKYGFHLRYPRNKKATTGYMFEPWHYRFVGLALAKELHKTQDITLEKFFNLPAAPDYAN